MKKKKTTININEQKKFEKFYGEWWDLKGPFSILHLFNYIRIDFIEQKLKENNTFFSEKKMDKLTFLDIGCGGGILCESLAKRGLDATGIDTSYNAIQIAKKHAKSEGLKINYQQSDLLEFKTDLKYDLVTCMEVLEHIDNIEILLEKIKKVLKPSGLFVGSTINKTIISFFGAIIVAEKFLNLLPSGTHDWKKFVEISKLKKLLVRSNFHSTEFQGIKYNPFLKQWSYSNIKSINYLFCAQPRFLDSKI